MKRAEPRVLKTEAEVLQTLGEQKLVHEIVKACSDAKGRHICVLDVREMFGLCDYFIIVSGRSDRQVQGICNKVLRTLETQRVKPATLEGFEKAHWVLMDFGDVVLHVFYEPIRAYYDLDALWAKAKRFEIREDDADDMWAA